MAVKTVEERLTVVEHKVAENARRIGGLREAIAELGERMDRRFEGLEQRFDQRLEAMEQRFDLRFLWLTGTLAATMLAVVTVLSAALFGGPG